ncbi:MAG: AAA family ATPase [Frankia sp.]|nr:AAA family ATPase [Frankia sp.]
MTPSQRASAVRATTTSRSGRTAGSCGARPGGRKSRRSGGRQCCGHIPTEEVSCPRTPGTGGYGVGKSSSILALERAGEHVVFEAAASIRALSRAEGFPFAEDSPNFESEVLALHLERERRVNPTAQRVFLDRGAPDHLAYSRVGRWPLTPEEVAACISSQYDLVFMIDPPSAGVPTLGRAERLFSDRLVTAIEAVYAEIGTSLRRVPYGACEDRVRFILNTVAGGHPTTLSSRDPKSTVGGDP